MIDSLGDRMKRHEAASKFVLGYRLPVILRVDGRAFHTFTRGMKRPFDDTLTDAMNAAAIELCSEIVGAQIAYVQSDEINLLIHSYKRHASQAWFANEVQKMTSVAASIATSTLSLAFHRACSFDARVFVLPESDVCNLFIWRQQDATRNSVQMVTRALYSHKECDGKNQTAMHEMMHARGVNWNDLPTWQKRGRCVVRETYTSWTHDVPEAVRSRWVVDSEIPIFTKDRAYIEKYLATEEEVNLDH